MPSVDEVVSTQISSLQLGQQEVATGVVILPMNLAEVDNRSRMLNPVPGLEIASALRSRLPETLRWTNPAILKISKTTSREALQAVLLLQDLAVRATRLPSSASLSSHPRSQHHQHPNLKYRQNSTRHHKDECLSIQLRTIGPRHRQHLPNLLPREPDMTRAIRPMARDTPLGCAK